MEPDSPPEPKRRRWVSLGLVAAMAACEVVPMLLGPGSSVVLWPVVALGNLAWSVAAIGLGVLALVAGLRAGATSWVIGVSAVLGLFCGGCMGLNALAGPWEPSERVKAFDATWVTIWNGHTNTDHPQDDTWLYRCTMGGVVCEVCGGGSVLWGGAPGLPDPRGQEPRCQD